MARHARSISPLLVPLLRATRSVQQAQAELRWIKQELPSDQWKSAIARRAQLVPLQYILGTQPFGPLDILCEPGVLIPRWETEEWTIRLVHVLRATSPACSVLDVCTGTGCVSLLVKHALPDASVAAVDLSDQALSLARRNRDRHGLVVHIERMDVLSALGPGAGRFDVVVANPPYIPAQDYDKPELRNGPARSVRLYEPRMALVGHLEFYAALVLNVVVPSGSRGLVFELGYEDQVMHTAAHLPPGWAHGRYFDLVGNLRCVVAWERGSEYECLRELVNEGPEAGETSQAGLD